MLRFCCGLLIFVVISVTLNWVVLAHPLSPIDALSKITEALNDTAATLIEQLAPNPTKNATNKTKTRILFRGDLLGDFNDQDIIFPDAYQLLYDFPKLTSPPKCSKGRTYCENFDSYPQQHLQTLLRRRKIGNDLFGRDEVQDEDRYSITNRNGDFEAFICSSIQRTIFPQVGKNKNNKWKLIINQKERSAYEQGIRVEYCRKEGSPCDLIGDRINGYITSCKQKYMYRRLMSVSETGDPTPDTFQLPSACCCSYKKDLSFLTNFGSEDISARNRVKTRSTLN